MKETFEEFYESKPAEAAGLLTEDRFTGVLALAMLLAHIQVLSDTTGALWESEYESSVGALAYGVAILEAKDSGVSASEMYSAMLMASRIHSMYAAKTLSIDLLNPKNRMVETGMRVAGSLLQAVNARFVTVDETPADVVAQIDGFLVDLFEPTDSP